MKRRFLNAKLHHAVVTDHNPEYIGSLTINQELLEASGIRPGEVVSVFDVDNAARFETYVLKGSRGGGEIVVNGAAAHLVAPGNRLIILTFTYLEPHEVDNHSARVVLVAPGNRIGERFDYGTRLDAEMNS